MPESALKVRDRKQSGTCVCHERAHAFSAFST